MNTVYLKVKVKAAAKKTEIKGKMADGTIKISIAAPPEKGHANKKLIELLADRFKTSPQNISIVHGVGSSSKLIKIII